MYVEFDEAGRLVFVGGVCKAKVIAESRKKARKLLDELMMA